MSQHRDRTTRTPYTQPLVVACARDQPRPDGASADAASCLCARHLHKQAVPVHVCALTLLTTFLPMRPVDPNTSTAFSRGGGGGGGGGATAFATAGACGSTLSSEGGSSPPSSVAFIDWATIPNRPAARGRGMREVQMCEVQVKVRGAGGLFG